MVGCSEQPAALLSLCAHQLTVEPGVNGDTSHFQWEDCSNWSIMGSQETTWLCGSSGIQDAPYWEVSWHLRRNCGRALCPSQWDIGGALLSVQLGSAQCTLTAILRRNYFMDFPMKGCLPRWNLFQEGSVNMSEELCDPRRERWPQTSKEEQVRDNFAHAMSMDFQQQWCTVPGAQGGCSAKAPANVGTLSKVLPVLVLLAATLLLRAWALPVNHQTFANSFTSYQ